MPLLPFGEFRPDVSDYQGQTTQSVLNVVPRGDGYGPFQDFVSFTSALPAACRGYFYARKADGSISVFAGTSTKLYNLNNTDGSWTDVSKGASTYSALSNNAQWQFAQFNNYVFATQANAPLQVFDLTASSAFDDAAGSPPQAAYITVVNRFLVLSGIASPNVYRIQWSGLNDVSSSSAWTAGVNQSDFQDLADGGIVRGVAGGEAGFIFQDQSIRQMTFAPGSPYVFSIQRISQDDGLFAPYSLINAGDRLFFCSPQGFKMLAPGGYPTPIGKERVDRTFFADLDQSNLQLFVGASDPRSTRVYWGYKSTNGAPGAFDKVLCYDWALDKWSPITMSGEYLASLSQPGITLEGVDAAYSPQTATFTVTIASPAVFTRASHGFTAGKQITLGTTGALPTGLATVTPYFVIATGLTTNNFRLSATFGGSAINTSGTQSGTHYLPTIDGLTIASLDDISNAALSKVSAVSSANILGFFTGAALEATLVTPEKADDGRRVFIRGIAPITDAGTVYGSVSARDTLSASATYSTETLINSLGVCPARVDTWYSRGKIRIPSGTTWTFVAGVVPDVDLGGAR